MIHELNDLVADVKEQVVYLRELGVESLDVKLPECDGIATSSELAMLSAAPADGVQATPNFVESKLVQRPATPVVARPPDARKTKSGSRIAALPRLTRRESSSSKIDPATIHETEMMLKTVAEKTTTDDALFGDISGLPESSESVQDVWADIGNCTRCPLHEGRTQIVQTVGNYN